MSHVTSFQMRISLCLPKLFRREDLVRISRLMARNACWTYSLQSVAYFPTGVKISHYRSHLSVVLDLKSQHPSRRTWWTVIGRSIPLKSVDTPVAYRPFEATAREPPRSTARPVTPSLVNMSVDGSGMSWILFYISQHRIVDGKQ